MKRGKFYSFLFCFICLIFLFNLSGCSYTYVDKDYVSSATILKVEKNSVNEYTITNTNKLNKLVEYVNDLEFSKNVDIDENSLSYQYCVEFKTNIVHEDKSQYFTLYILDDYSAVIYYNQWVEGNVRNTYEEVLFCQTTSVEPDVIELERFLEDEVATRSYEVK